MKYIIPIATADSQFDENQMKVGLGLGKQLETNDFICMAGWDPSSRSEQVWEKQRIWLVKNGIASKYISCPDNMSWPGENGVQAIGQAVSLFDQVGCVACLTTDDVYSKGEIFFVGPWYLEQLVRELVRFHQIPRCPLSEQFKYYMSGSRHDTIPCQLKDSIESSLRVLSDRTSVGFGWVPRTHDQYRRHKRAWLKKYCL